MGVTQFLCVALGLVASSGAETIKLGDIETFHHDAGGEVFAFDENTLVIKDFTYDGTGKKDRQTLLHEQSCWKTTYFQIRPRYIYLGWH